jgi:uncharacterized protein YdaU (DUF1376 family)
LPPLLALPKSSFLSKTYRPTKSPLLSNKGSPSHPDLHRSITERKRKETSRSHLPLLKIEGAQLRIENERLKEENAQLKEESARSSAENACWRKRVDRLREENGHLREQNFHFREGVPMPI